MIEPKAATPIATDDFIQYTTEIVSAYVGRNSLTTADVPPFIVSIYDTLKGLGGQHEPEPEQPAALEPAVPIRKSVRADAIICLECGKHFTSIRRHLGTAHNLTPEQYRERWQLPANYPLVTVGYSQARSAVAKAAGLGRRAEEEPAKPVRAKRTAVMPARGSRTATTRTPRPKR